MTLSNTINIEEIVTYLESCSPDTKVYVGCDSAKYRKNGIWRVDYTLAVVIHKDGRHGCKVFGAVHNEVDYDRKKDRPSFRLMNEVYKAAELYIKLAEVVNHDIAIHLDLNPSAMHGSNCVVSQAIGYIRGVCGIDPEIKPDAWAASYAADRLKEIII